MGLLLALLASLTAGCERHPTVPIFLWHAVGEGSGDRYDVPPAEFDQELSLLDHAGAHVITLDELFDALDQRRPLPPRAVVLTFDDGRACLYSQAMPLLLKHHMRAEAFLVTSLLGPDAAHRVRNADDTGAHPYLVWPEVRQMLDSGAFRVEAHSESHPRLPSTGWSRQREEIIGSALLLRARLNAPVHFFAYPFGSVGFVSEWWVWKAGYRGAVSVNPRTGPWRYTLARISLHRGGVAQLQQALASAFGGPETR